MESKERILEMEKLFVEAENDPKRADELMDELEEIIDRLSTLAKYSRERLLEDLDWERGHPIPLEELTTGILSEDGLYNLLGNEFERAVRLQEMALKILKSI